MASTIVLLLAVWATTVPVVLGVARLLGRWTGPRAVALPDAEAAARDATRPLGNVVPLAPRPRNTLVPRPAESLREAS